jgi:hypothetical protein
MITASLYPIPSPDTISRVLEGETVLVLPTRGLVNVLNELGQYVWNLIDGHRSVEDIVTEVCNEYNVSSEQARQDVMSFLQLLSEKGALVLESRPL